MPNLRRVALPVLALALIAGLAWRGTAGDPARQPQPPQPQPSTTVLASTPEIAQPAPPSPVAAATTPDESALPPALAELVDRAEAGDSRAACALGTRLLVCTNSHWFADMSLESLRRQEREAEAEGDHESANQAAGMLLSATVAKKACADLTPGLRQRAFEFTRQAALAGEPEAIVRYATGQALAGNGMAPNTFLRSPHFDTWRSEAPALLEALEQSGDPQAVLALLMATSEGNNLALLMPPDPVRDAAYRLLAHRLFGEHAALANFRMPKIPAQQRREAEALARAWHRERFGNRSVRLEEHTSGLFHPLYQHLEGNWPKPSVDVPVCFDMDAGVEP